MIRKASILCVWSVCLLIAGGGSTTLAAVTLHSQSDVIGSTVRLSDVFDGLPQGIDREIATAPLPGQSVTYDAQVLGRLAQQYRLDWQGQSLTEKCILTRASTKITSDTIRDAVITKVKETNDDLRDMQLELLFDNRNLEVLLPVDQPATFVLNNFRFDSEGHRFRADLLAGNAPKPVVLAVSGRINVKRNIPVFTHRMETGAIITQSDLAWQSISLNHVPADLMTSQDSLIGKEVRHDVAEDTPLRSRDIALPRLIVHGSLVTMKIETPAMLVMTQGRAMQDGAVGDVIRLMNVQTKRVIEGTVIANNTVRIDLPQRIPSQASVSTRVHSDQENMRWP